MQPSAEYAGVSPIAPIETKFILHIIEMMRLPFIKQNFLSTKTSQHVAL